IIKKFLEEGRVEAKKRGGDKAHKLTDEQKLAVRGWAEEDRRISLAKLKEKCLSTFGVAVSEATISRLLKTFSSTATRRTPLQPKRRGDGAETIDARWLYAQSLLQLFAQQLVHTQMCFADQASSSTSSFTPSSSTVSSSSVSSEDDRGAST
uniref:Transposase n=1 Tax=Plectus sambesii TaxID=2011161 RepID=A0A914XVQ5_9BILA